MKDALRPTQDKLNVKFEKMYIWLDILAIPQRNPSLKSLAVNSLYTYARQADALVIISPESTHENLGVPAGTESYKSRVWCRVEQMAFFCAKGAASMLHVISPGQVSNVPDNWMDEVAIIFDGEMTCCRLKHPNGQECDKLSIVTPLIGMYFDLYTMHESGNMDKHAQATWNFIENRKDRIFPKTFQFANEKDHVIVKELFGLLICRIDAFVKKDLQKAIALSTCKMAELSASHGDAAHTNESLLVPIASAKDVPSASPSGNLHNQVSI